jgi:hypothetical protein
MAINRQIEAMRHEHSLANETEDFTGTPLDEEPAEFEAEDPDLISLADIGEDPWAIY